MSRLFSIGWIAMLAVSASALAQEYKVGDIRIAQPYARPSVAAQSSGAIYLSIENLGKNSDQLVSAASPVANSVELHTMSMQGNVMKMREVANIEIKPSEKIVMVRGHGYHIMLIGLKQPLRPGDKVPLTLHFKNAGKVETQATVEDKKTEGGHATPHGAMHGNP
jgi:periplasmic copper chaperone A